MNYNSDIILLSINLSEGESLRALCPVCNGGSNTELCLSITRDNGIIWQCFRAKCGYKGYIGEICNRDPTSVGETISKRKVWEGVTHEVPDEVVRRVYQMWGLKDVPHWYWTTDFGGRVAMSVRSPHDTHRGWVLRAIGGTQRTKALTYINDGEEALSWYKTQPHAPTVVVEDIPSAIRASMHVNSVALLGTGISTPRAMEISTYATGSICMALDQDATALSFKWARKYSLLWGNVTVLPLKKDLKDMTEEELCSLLT